MRIASGGVQHETNTFSQTPTTLEDFQRDSGCDAEFPGGEFVFQRYRGTGTIHGGYIEAAESSGIELLPLLSARAQPSGKVAQEAFDGLRHRFLERLEDALPVDCVALDLHGAMVTEKYEDGEGAFIAAVRDVVGPDVPVFVTLDLHANITPRMAELADVIIGFDTYPHVDMRERGREAVELLSRTIRGEVRPVQEYRQLPLLTLPPKQCTLREPMHGLMQRVFQLEERPGVLTATVSMGFPFADIRDAGVSVLVTGNGDSHLANETADELAGWLWDLRDDLQPELVTIEEVMRFANQQSDGPASRGHFARKSNALCRLLPASAAAGDHPAGGARPTRGPVIFADGSDNPGGGAPCDGTVALRALIEAGFQGAVVGILCDPETVDQAHAAGVGAVVDARIGGKTDDRHGKPVEAQAYVRTLGDGRFVHRGPMMRGVPGNLGRMAVLVAGGVEVVVSANRRQLLDAEMLRIVGIAPEQRRLLVVKSAVHFRADLGPLASAIFDGDTPGIHRPDFENFEYHNLRRPIYPLDREIEFHNQL